MRAMILAAGRGERMRPLTDNTPKPLLNVGNQRLIEFHLSALSAAGFCEVIINTSYLAEQIESYLGDGSRYQLNIQYSRETTALETGGGIYKALPLLGKDPFLVVNGDIWCDYPYSQLPQQLSGLAHLVVVSNPPHHLEGDFEKEGQWLLSGREGFRNFTFSGIGIYHPELFSKCTFAAFKMGPLLREAMNQRLITGEFYQGQWYDIGTPERLLELRKHLGE